MTRSQLYQQLLRRANSHFARNLMLYLFVHSKSFSKNAKKRRSKKSLLSLLGKGRRPQRSRGPGARARARAKYPRVSRAYIGKSTFCSVNLRSVSGKVVQFLEFGKCAKSKIDSFRFGNVMIKMNVYLRENHSKFYIIVFYFVPNPRSQGGHSLCALPGRVRGVFAGVPKGA